MSNYVRPDRATRRTAKAAEAGQRSRAQVKPDVLLPAGRGRGDAGAPIQNRLALAG
jgi:hypothetical protein